MNSGFLMSEHWALRPKADQVEKKVSFKENFGEILESSSSCVCACVCGLACVLLQSRFPNSSLLWTKSLWWLSSE